MSMSFRLGLLGAVGVLAAGFAQAGWLWWAWPVDAAARGLAANWTPLLVQGSWTLVLAAAIAWQLRRDCRPLQQSLALLREQVQALEQGRFVIAEDPPAAEALPLARSLNAAVRRLQAVIDEAPGQGAQALRRTARRDAQTGLDSRYTFIARLTERLADRSGAQTALLALRRLPAAGAQSAFPVPDARSAFPVPDGQAAPPAQGHALSAAAELLQRFARRIPGAFVGRFGDSELALCLPAHDVVAESAASLLAALGSGTERLPCAVGCVDHLGGASLGGALAQLELATAEAAAAGPGQLVCRTSLREEAGAAGVEDADLRRQIVDALRANALSLAAFPVLDARGALLHLECPMRLRLQVQEPPAPAEAWLAVATRYRLTTQIDLVGVELALAACAQDGRPRCVHVASESLAAAGFVSAVRARLQAAPQAAALLWIEIAEVSLERLPPRLRNAGTVWRRCGARVGIEHAGLALRKLLRLSELEVDYVKVDADFVRGIAGSAEQRERAQGLVAFVHEMGAQVIAEGVDEEADLHALWALGFDGATGAAASRRAAAFEACVPSEASEASEASGSSAPARAELALTMS